MSSLTRRRVILRRDTDSGAAEPDLKFRAETSKAVAFIGDAESCARFEEVSKEVGISLIYQARTPGDGGLGKGRKDFQAAIEKVPRDTKCEASHKKTDLALIFFTSGTTGAPKMVLLEVRRLVDTHSQKARR